MNSTVNYKISYLLTHSRETRMTLAEAMAKTQLTKKELDKQLQSLAVAMDSESYLLPAVSAISWTELYLQKQRSDVAYSEKERRALIILTSYSQFDELSVFHFQELLQVSKGIILSDIRRVREELASQKISLDYNRKNGFYLTGDDYLIRKMARNELYQLLQHENGRFGIVLWCNQKNILLYSQMRDVLQEKFSEYDLAMPPSRIDELAIYLAVSSQRKQEISLPFQAEEVRLLKSLQAYQASRSLLKEISETTSENETIFLTLCLMTVLQGELQDSQLDFLLHKAAEIIHRMETLAAIEFTNFRELLINLFSHLVPTYFRIKYDFILPNPLLENIKQQYASIFRLTKQALVPLEKLVAKSIPEDELGYFTILFGGELDSRKQHNKEVRGLIVCPSGISSSIILQSELKQLFPTIKFQDASSIGQMKNISEDSYDLIFSTVPIESEKRVYLTKPIMSQLEKNRLINQIQQDWLIPGLSLPSAEEILAAIRPYIQFKPGVDEEKIYKILNRKMNKLIERKEDNRPMLSELITEETIQFSDETMTWEEAIQLSAEPLLKNGAIETKYIQAMTDRVKQFGPFFNIGDHIALPHARPEDGVHQVGMSLLKVKEAVDLGDDPAHPVTIFICLAAIDNEAHLRALASLTKILGKKENLQALLKAETKQEILAILHKGEE